ncbi:hypothetical protein [Lyngbya sp. CCY1209]|uniref:hypothetical protein n=1 Tax=Lyngbya sp. CCY1209 TaxID=2886103 RepID=UPI002D213F5C|nr:hypothetical protein [Lyngbya sp. CCY1209]MEB3884327.1 hypothetical protein [Lyngbya sp. CCY1209]
MIFVTMCLLWLILGFAIAGWALKQRDEVYRIALFLGGGFCGLLFLFHIPDTLQLSIEAILVVGLILKTSQLIKKVS